MTVLYDPFQLLGGCGVRVTSAARADAVHDDVSIAQLLGTSSFVTLRQVHGAEVVRTDVPSRRTFAADAALTDCRGLSLVIRFADCQGLVLVDPVSGAIGVIHAGWRGLVAGVIGATVRRLCAEWHADPALLRVGIGPSLCLACADFTDPLREAPALAPFVSGRCIDLQAASLQQLLDAGVVRQHVERHPDCTRCHPERAFSYRGGDREAVQSGFTNFLAIQRL